MKEFEHVEILLAEDNPHDAELAIRGLEKQKLANLRSLGQADFP